MDIIGNHVTSSPFHSSIIPFIIVVQKFTALYEYDIMSNNDYYNETVRAIS